MPNSQIEKLHQIQKENPTATHVYIRRSKDGVTIDVPVGHAELTLKNNPTWEIVSSNKQMEDEVEQLFREPEDEPIAPHNPWEKKIGTDDLGTEERPVESQIEANNETVDTLPVPEKPSRKRRGRPKKI